MVSKYQAINQAQEAIAEYGRQENQLQTELDTQYALYQDIETSLQTALRQLSSFLLPQVRNQHEVGHVAS